MKTFAGEFHARSAFSFLRGANLPEQMVEQAIAMGYETIAFTDHGGFYGSARAHKTARDSDKGSIKAIDDAAAGAVSGVRVPGPACVALGIATVWCAAFHCCGSFWCNQLCLLGFARLPRIVGGDAFHLSGHDLAPYRGWNFDHMPVSCKVVLAFCKVRR